jgi:hypothetical protein
MRMFLLLRKVKKQQHPRSNHHQASKVPSTPRIMSGAIMLIRIVLSAIILFLMSLPAVQAAFSLGYRAALVLFSIFSHHLRVAADRPAAATTGHIRRSGGVFSK